MKRKIRKIFWITITVIILLITAMLLLLPTILGHMFTSKKTTFTDSQTTLIAEKLDLDPTKITVNKVIYNHSQDKSFVFDISLKDIDSVEQNYIYSRDEDEKKVYSNKNKSYLFCEISKKDSEYSGQFEITDHFDKELDDLMDN
jgi:hypothetical protein